MDNNFLSPATAASLVERYYFFLRNPDKDTGQDLYIARKTILLIGLEYGFSTFEQALRFLQNVAAGSISKSAVPSNLKSLVAEYEKFQRDKSKKAWETYASETENLGKNFVKGYKDERDRQKKQEQEEQEKANQTTTIQPGTSTVVQIDDNTKSADSEKSSVPIAQELAEMQNSSETWVQKFTNKFRKVQDSVPDETLPTVVSSPKDDVIYPKRTHTPDPQPVSEIKDQSQKTDTIEEKYTEQIESILEEFPISDGQKEHTVEQIKNYVKNQKNQNLEELHPEAIRTAIHQYFATTPADEPKTDSKQEEITSWVNDEIEAKTAEQVKNTLESLPVSQEVKEKAAEEIHKYIKEIKESGVEVPQEAFDKALKEYFLDEHQVDLTQNQTDSLRQSIASLLKPQTKDSNSYTPPWEKTGARPNTRITYPTTALKETIADVPDVKEKPDKLLYLLLRPASYRDRAFGQFSLLWGKRSPTTAQKVEFALQRLQIENPRYYSENLLAVELIREQVLAISQIEKQIDSAEFIDPNDIEKLQEKINFQKDKIIQLEVNTSLHQVSTKSVSPFSFASQATSKMLQTKTVLQTQSAFKNIVSNLQLNLNKLMKDPNLGWLRTSLSTGLGVGALAFPVVLPIKIAMLFGSGGLGILQIRHTPQLLSIPANMIGQAFSYQRKSPFSDFGPLNHSRMIMMMMGFIAVFPLIAGLGIGILGHGTFLGGGKVGERNSDYIKVIKTTPKESYPNDGIPDTIPFKIKVNAIKAKLTSVTIVDDAKVNGKSINENLGSQSWQVGEIASTWEQDYNLPIPGDKKPQMADSIITNVVNVTATVDDPEKGRITDKASFLVTIRIGAPPEDCPSGWPTAKGWINQGPNGSATHTGSEAIDIHGNRGDLIYATMRGTAYPFVDQYGGLDIELVGSCNGKTMKILYAHFNTWSVASGTVVKPGDLLGKMGCTGWCTNDHLHYEFRGGFTMAPPYIPVSIPRGCVGQAACNNIAW